jgi:hypothetical protein
MWAVDILDRVSDLSRAIPPNPARVACTRAIETAAASRARVVDKCAADPLPAKRGVQVQLLDLAVVANPAWIAHASLVEARSVE